MVDQRSRASGGTIGDKGNQGEPDTQRPRGVICPRDRGAPGGEREMKLHTVPGGFKDAHPPFIPTPFSSLSFVSASSYHSPASHNSLTRVTDTALPRHITALYTQRSQHSNMPTFQPPLTHVSAVPIPQSTGNSVRYLHLTFALTFEEHEDRSGSWEIWSNIPELQSTPGEWRALTFESEGMASEASSAGEAARSTSTRLTRQMSLIAERGQTFEYTFRHVLESGEIVWLGDGAHNGKLEFVADQREPVEDGRPEIDLDIISWEGIGLELSSTHPK